MILMSELLRVIEDTAYLIVYTLDDDFRCEGMAKDLQATYCFDTSKVVSISISDDNMFIRIK